MMPPFSEGGALPEKQENLPPSATWHPRPQQMRDISLEMRTSFNDKIKLIHIIKTAIGITGHIESNLRTDLNEI